MYLGHRDIGVKLGVRCAPDERVVPVVGFDDDGVENAEFLERDVLPVVEGDIGGGECVGRAERKERERRAERNK